MQPIQLLQIKGWRKKAVLLALVCSLAVCLVTRFVDFSNSPLTWTHAGPTQGKRPVTTPDALPLLPPAILVLAAVLQALQAEQGPATQPVQHNLYKRPPPLA